MDKIIALLFLTLPASSMPDRGLVAVG